MRWGLDAGRKTMVATAMLLLTLSGPVKASTYLLMHGLVGVTMGSLWRLGINWGISVVLCTIIICSVPISTLQVLQCFLLFCSIIYARALNSRVRALGAI